MVRMLNVGRRVAVRRRLLTPEEISQVGFVGLSVLIRSVTGSDATPRHDEYPARQDPKLLREVDDLLPRLKVELPDAEDYAVARDTVAGLMKAIDGLA